MDVVVQDGRHLPLLDRRDRPGGVHHEDSHALAPANAVDGSAAGVAAGGGEDVHRPLPPGEDVLEQVAQQLQRNVLERQRRAVEKLHHEEVADWHGRRDSLGKRLAVGTVYKLAEVRLGYIRREQADHFERQLRVTQVPPIIEFVGDVRDGLRNDKPAVVGQAHQNRLLKVDSADLSSCRNVFHR